MKMTILVMALWSMGSIGLVLYISTIERRVAAEAEVREFNTRLELSLVKAERDEAKRRLALCRPR